MSHLRAWAARLMESKKDLIWAGTSSGKLAAGCKENTLLQTRNSWHTAGPLPPADRQHWPRVVGQVSGREQEAPGLPNTAFLEAQ